MVAARSGPRSSPRKRIQLPLDALFLIEKPPRAAQLDLPRDRRILEIADRRGEAVIIGWITVVDNCLRQGVLALQQIQIAAQRRRLWPVADRIEDSVGAEFPLPSPVHVAQCTQVQLFRPILRRVQTSEK